ncbi:MAG: ABC transporter permease [bacterium]|nr:ABC transporter permease [bacterium]
MMFLFIKMMIRQHIRRSAMIIFGIACSVAMMFSMIQMGDSINRKYKEMAMGTNRHDFHISNLTWEQAELLKEKWDEKKIEASGIGYSDYWDLGMRPEAFPQVTLELCAGTKGGFEEPGLRLHDGKWSEQPDEIVLEQYVCEMLGSGIGDEVTVVCDSLGTSYRFRIVGIMENSPILSSDGWQRGFMCVSFGFLYEAGLITPETEAHQVFVTINSDVDAYDSEKMLDYADESCQMLGALYGIDYWESMHRVVAGEAGEEEAALLRKINQNVGTNSVKMENIQEYESQSQIGNALKGFVVLIAVALVFLIFNSMYLTIAENTRELGMLRCIGMDYRQTGLIIFAENICYCLIGYWIGILFGNVLNQGVAGTILYYLAGDAVEIRQLGSSYLLTAVDILISFAFAFGLSIRKIFRLTPIEASKYNGLTVKNRKVRPMEKWSALRFAGRNIGRERGKSAIVMISMIFSMTVLLLVVNTVLSVKQPEKDPKSQFSDYEIYVPLNVIADVMDGIIPEAGVSDAEMAELRNTAGVEEVYAIGWSPFREDFIYSLKNDSLISAYTYNEAMFRWLLEQNGAAQLWEQSPDAICVVAGAYGEEKQEMLDEIEAAGAVAYRLESGKEGAINVAGVLHADYVPTDKGSGDGSVMLILTEKAAREVYGRNTYLDVMVKCGPDADDGIYREIAMIFAGNENVVCGSYEVGMEQEVKNGLSIIYVAALIAAATAVTAVLNMMIIMKANLVLRRKEHGIWRALGMHLRRLKGTIRIEILFMLLISYAVAMVLSFPLQRYLCGVMENFDPMKLLTGYLFVGIGSVLFVYLLVMSGLKFRGTHQIMADIKEE